MQPQQRFNEESSDVGKLGSIEALLGSDPLENGGEFGGRCDANPEPSIALTRAKARVETMGRPLSEKGEDIVRSTRKVELVGFPVQVLRFNGSSLTVDMYIPSGTVYGLNTNYIDLYVTTERKYQFGFRKPVKPVKGSPKVALSIKSRELGERLSEKTPSQAAADNDSAEGVTVREVTSKNNLPQERATCTASKDEMTWTIRRRIEAKIKNFAITISTTGWKEAGQSSGFLSFSRAKLEGRLAA